METEFLNDLKRKIWITKNSRISLAERFLKKNHYWTIINLIYAIYIIGLSIYGITQNSNYNLVILFLSIAITMVSLFSNSQNYKDRAISLKYHYIKLENLYNKLNFYLDSNVENIRKIDDEYQNQLLTSENHKTIDWINAIKNDKDEKDTYNKFKWYKKIYFFCILLLI